jgi:hypothetical protein
MRATPRRERFPVEVQKSSELQALHRRNARISTMRAPVPREAWLAVERGPYLLGFRANGQGMDKTPTTRKTPPDQSPKTADLQALYGANRDRTGDLLLANRLGGHLEVGRFGGCLLVAGSRLNGTKMCLFAYFSGGFGTKDRALVPMSPLVDKRRLLQSTAGAQGHTEPGSRPAHRAAP